MKIAVFWNVVPYKLTDISEATLVMEAVCTSET
jgi:hypothetical protein